jgi:mannose-1-phosphate guanylyltransferase
MINIVKDIQLNCPECATDVEKTVKFLFNRGDFSYTSEHYREVYFFYTEAIKLFKNKAKARRHTIEMFKISPEKFKTIKKRLG